MRKIYLLLLLNFGCSVSPVPKNVEQWHFDAQQKIPLISREIQAGDILFRLSNTQLLGGLIDFSQEVAKATESDFSHAVLVYKVADDGVILADITNTGIARRYLIDWYLDGTTNLVVKRLKPEFSEFIPLVLLYLNQYIEEDVLYDAQFVAHDKYYYCTELVDICFRKAGCPLAPKVRIKDWPHYNLLVRSGCLFGGINTNSEVAIVGNEQTGLFSSNKLYTVFDFRR